MDLNALHQLARAAARTAGDEIRAIKHPLITQKPDGSVLTSADLRSNEIIFDMLAASKIPICSEEKILSYEKRAAGDFWLIDPLDGSNNYAKTRSGYCVAIALIRAGRPIIAAIYDPVAGELFSALKGSGVLRNEEPLGAPPAESFRALISLRARSNAHNDQFIIDHDYEPLALGSALKFCALLDGRADVYVRFESLNAWDIAAGDLLVNEAGGLMLGLHRRAINYARADFGCPGFIALAPAVGASTAASAAGELASADDADGHPAALLAAIAAKKAAEQTTQQAQTARATEKEKKCQINQEK